MWTNTVAGARHNYRRHTQQKLIGKHLVKGMLRWWEAYSKQNKDKWLRKEDRQQRIDNWWKLGPVGIVG